MSNGQKPQQTQARTDAVAGAGLPESTQLANDTLRETGVDPDRLSIIHLGHESQLAALPPWARRLLLAAALLAISLAVDRWATGFPEWLRAGIQLVAGLAILQSACEILIIATERLAARFQWNHYTAGTVAEILATLPELVVIAFVVVVSPEMAFTLATITIYNNALVFSLYSYFLPKDSYGKYVMPRPITEAGTQILIGGGAMGLVLGLVMLTFTAGGGSKSSISPIDLVFVSFILLTMFSVYLYKLVTGYAQEEAEVRETLAMSPSDLAQRMGIVYAYVKPSSFAVIAGLFFLGIVGAVVGGEQVSRFASGMVDALDINPVLTALVLALFAGMSEYVILWQSHRKQEYGIALANAFGGITQVMFLVLPITLLCIAGYHALGDPVHPELPLEFSLTSIFLLIFLFPTFYTLTSLLEEDHTLGLLDTTIMTGIFLFLIVLLVTYGAS